MTKTPVKCQRYRSKTVGGVAYTRYLLLEEGRVDGLKAEYYVLSLFFEKAGDNNNTKKTTTKKTHTHNYYYFFFNLVSFV